MYEDSHIYTERLKWMSGNLKTVKYLIKKGAIINDDVLHQTVFRNQYKIVKYYIKKCKIDISNIHTDITCTMAITYGFFKIVKLFFTQNINYNKILNRLIDKDNWIDCEIKNIRTCKLYKINNYYLIK